ncbi:MAG: family 43 glycosylhydrolase [Acholeplasmatales bacterium]|jgi:hypothetical protein|nr:family 43 glycosylhydrolase [Acholeplasmatales bacterium]
MKKIIVLLLLITGVSLLIACKKDNDDDIISSDFSYIEEKLSDNLDYNTDLFYLNSLEFEIADPTVIYINEGKEKGYFYAYGTSDDINCNGFQSWRSKDLTHWESVGVAFVPDFANTWAVKNYWAPEILFDEEDGLYYLFYSAETLGQNGFYQLSVAYSENPEGPFITPDNVRNADGNMLYGNKPVYNVGPDQQLISSDKRRKNAIDISPFIDPISHKKYIYFSYYDTFSKSEIFGMEMKDWFTPIYSTLTQLTSVGYLTVEAGLNNDITQRTPEGTINEGPFVIYENGVYYLTLSVYGYRDEKYQVRQALSDSPLGVYTKYLPEDGGTVIATDISWDHITSAGHHSFVKCGDTMFIAYHTFKNRSDISEGRALAIDEVKFVLNDDGVNLIHSNGPTFSLQPLPEKISSYKNIAPLASVTATNTKSTSSVSYLTDTLIKYHDISKIEEYEANTGVSTITFNFDNFVTLRSIMIYNSIYFENTFSLIDDIAITYKYSDTETRIVHQKSLEFDWDWNAMLGYDSMRPGGAVVTEFHELTVKKIEITLRSVGDSTIGIGEIVLLGKDKDSGPTNSFSEYSYTNNPFPSPIIKVEGNEIGSNHGLNTKFGYDLTHDDGTPDKYILQKGPYDQYAYFKDVWSTKFYIEASITATSNTSFALDAYPKYGLTVITPENTIFFYVDGIGKSTYGVAQRKLDNSDWDWNATEQLVTIPSTSSNNGNYVKLSIIRDGANFYFLVNDVLAITYKEFNIFIDDYESTCGFLTFNTEIKIKEYQTSTDESLIAQKIESYESSNNGNVFGQVLGYSSTSGWNLQTDDGTPLAYVANTLGGDQYLYFKNSNANLFYVETKISVVASLQDPFPKFGISLKSGNSELFFYIDSNTSFNQKKLGYVQRDSSGNWDWSHSVTKDFPKLNNYSEDSYATLSILRNKNVIYLYAEHEVVFTLTDLVGFTTNLNCVVSVLVFNTKIKVKDYFLVLNEEEVLSYLS